MILRVILIVLLMCSGVWAGNVAMLGGGYSEKNPATLIFSNGFESNNFSAWSSETDSANQLGVISSASCHSGDYCAQYIYSSTSNAIVSKSLTQNYTESYFNFWFNVNDVTGIATDINKSQTIANIQDTASNNQLVVNATSSSSPYNFVTVRMWYYKDSGSATLDFTLNPSEDTWYCYQAYRKKSSGVNTNDGILRVWVSETCGGGTPVSLTDIDDDTKNMFGKINLGESLGNDWTTTNGTTFLFDDFAFYDGAP